jgi:adenosine/AMP kinase
MTRTESLAVRNASAIAAGHTFVVVMKEGYPINVLAGSGLLEVCSIFAQRPTRWR